MTERPPSLQFGLRGVLVAVSVICAISVFFPWTGLVVTAYLPAVIGFRLYCAAESMENEVKSALALGLMTFGYLAGSVILAAFANLFNQ